MKKISFVLMLFASLQSVSQDSARLLSDFEKFSSTTGKMYKYESIDIGKVKDIYIYQLIKSQM